MKFSRHMISDEIPTASMADVTFLLIITFMLTSTFAASRGLDFALPQNVKRADNIGGITGGVKLWDPALDDLFPRPKAKK